MSSRFRPIGVYRGLDAGPNWGRQSVAAKSSAIDGTQKKLRDPRLGSPFTFRVIPPSILVDALLGRGAAESADNVYDPLLRQQFDAAQADLEVAQANLDAGTGTAEEVELARQGLLGGRAPAGGQNIDIIESATRSMNNFNSLKSQRNQARASNFFANGKTRGATLTRLEDMIGSNGIRFNPQEVGETEANQAAVSDLIQALDVIVQLNRMLATPDLTLLVNPEQLQITYAKKQTYQERNRFNYIFQSWGEEQVRLSVSGRCPAFVVGSGALGDPDININPQTGDETVNRKVETTSVSGYQYVSKLDSAGWQNLMALFTFYRNNGYIYDTAGRPRSEAHLFIGNIEIEYDQWSYVGNFENFTYQYEETKQHGAISFSFEFVASHVFDRAQGGSVRGWNTPPTPSPSQSSGGGATDLPNQQAKATATATDPELADQGTAVLDPIQLQSGSLTFQEALGGGPSFGVAPLTLSPFPGPTNGGG